MGYWWARYSDGTKARFIYTPRVKGDQKAAAERLAAEQGQVKEVLTLPYPAGNETAPDGCPPFCYTPEQCAGRSCCPKDYACSE